MADEQGSDAARGEQRLFAYGTLMRGEPLHGLLAEHARLVSEGALAEGALLDQGEWPALVRSGGGTKVQGELYALREPAAALSALDEAEGDALQRELLQVELEDGSSCAAWAYVLGEGPRGRPIASGSWREHRQPR